jgi:glycosyltransferase involved in cell wall biosynthesis
MGTQLQYTPLVSVVIPTRGRPDLLVQRALRSALAQTLSDYEVIVVVDGPDPETELALAALSNPRLSVLVLPSNVGGADARNAGIQNARGEWIALLDDDDEWFPDKIQRQLDVARRSTHAQPVIACQWITRTPRGDEQNPTRPLDPDEPISEYLMARRSMLEQECCIVSSLLIARRDLFLRVPFTSGLRKHQDWDWMVRVSGQPGVSFELAPETLAVFYFGEKRAHMSRTTNWRWSLEWAKSHRDAGRLTNRAYAGFIVSQLAPFAAREHDTSAFWPLLREVWVARPPAFQFLRYALIWIVPMNARRILHDVLMSARS